MQNRFFIYPFSYCCFAFFEIFSFNIKNTGKWSEMSDLIIPVKQSVFRNKLVKI